MRMKTKFIVILASLVLSSAAHAEWPPWARDVFGERPGWRDGPPFDGAPANERRRNSFKTEAISDGGTRPEIEPQSPEVIHFQHDVRPSSIVIDTARRKLYYVLPDQRAYAYPISVGREGFNWTGTETISRKQAWPDWHPPAEMRDRDPKLPEKMTGGIRNPLGAMALYLGSTLYRIHGTNDIKSIGQAQSSGCFRMKNAHVLHLAGLVEQGTTVSVVTALPEAPIASGLRQTTPNTHQAERPPMPPSLPGQLFGYRDLRDYTFGRQ